MKIEIELDETLVQKISKNARSLSFSKSLELLRAESALLRRKSKQRFPSFLLDSKLITHEFSKKLNINTPQIYQIDESLDDMQFSKNMVIKPMYENQSVGVFICKSENEIDYLKENLKFDNFIDSKLYAKKLLEQGIVRQNRWMSEQLITLDSGIARDVKFYMFYGQIGLVLESARSPSLKRCWYDSNFKYIKTGKYDKNLFKGDSSNLKQLAELAKFISLEIPVPFIRIDFLQNDEGIYLGELTPIPSGYKSFNTAVDSFLGELYQRATTRLSYDISLGKKFENYWNLNKSEVDIIHNMKNNT